MKINMLFILFTALVLSSCNKPMSTTIPFSLQLQNDNGISSNEEIEVISGKLRKVLSKEYYFDQETKSKSLIFIKNITYDSNSNIIQYETESLSKKDGYKIIVNNEYRNNKLYKSTFSDDHYILYNWTSNSELNIYDSQLNETSIEKYVFLRNSIMVTVLNGEDLISKFSLLLKNNRLVRIDNYSRWKINDIVSSTIFSYSFNNLITVSYFENNQKQPKIVKHYKYKDKSLSSIEIMFPDQIQYYNYSNYDQHHNWLSCEVLTKYNDGSTMLYYLERELEYQ